LPNVCPKYENSGEGLTSISISNVTSHHYLLGYLVSTY